MIPCKMSMIKSDTATNARLLKNHFMTILSPIEAYQLIDTINNDTSAENIDFPIAKRRIFGLPFAKI